MTTRMRLFVTIVCALALLSNAAGVVGQEKRPPREVVVQGEGQTRVWVGSGPGQVAMAGPQGDKTFTFVSTEMGIASKVVKGAPYSAQAINESVQTLAGGNRIVRTNTSTIYRDSEGRTRREQSISVVGGFSSSGEPVQTTFINDPVTGVNYILDAKNRTARKIDYSAKIAVEKKAVEKIKAKMTAEGGASGDEKMAAEKIVVAEKMAVAKAGGGEFRYEMRTEPGAGPVISVGTRSGSDGPGLVMMGNKKNTKKEDIGKQTVEGVEAEGTRYVTTIAAGEIGNEQPIEIVFESWFSPELQTVVMSKHSDPRSGENTYRLTNINRSEPSHSLFEVPSDYTINEAGPPVEMRRKIEMEKRRPGSEQ